jgi:hypothetical protein
MESEKAGAAAPGSRRLSLFRDCVILTPGWCESTLGFLASCSFSGHGTKWHWLATFEKVFISDLQVQKRVRSRSGNGLVQASRRGRVRRDWASLSGALPTSDRCAGMAQSGTGWQHLRRSSSPISKLRNELASACETGWYSRRRRCRGVPFMSLYFDANAYAGLHWHNRANH